LQIAFKIYFVSLKSIDAYFLNLKSDINIKILTESKHLQNSLPIQTKKLI